MKDVEQVQLNYLTPWIANLQMLDQKGKNAFSKHFVTELIQKLTTISNNERVKVVLISGLSEVFCSGADLETLQELGNQKKDPTDIILSRILLHLPVPVIAAMEGHAVGGGLALGLCADMVFLARESRYGLPFINMGFTPGMGTTRLLEHFLTPAVAHEMLYSGVYRQGKSFQGNSGFTVLPKTEVFKKALELAERIAEKPRKSLVLLKRTLSLPRRKRFEETFNLESMMHEICFNQNEILESIQENYVGKN